MPEKKEIIVIFNAQVSGKSMGGGDKIVLSYCKYCPSNLKLRFVGCIEGKEMMESNLKLGKFSILNNQRVQQFGLIPVYLYRIITSPLILKCKFNKRSILWSASDFMPDTLPALWYKLFHPQTTWFANFFLVARNPFRGEIELNLPTILFFVSQRVSMILFKLFADKIFVLSLQDKRYLQKHNLKNVDIISGGIDYSQFNRIKSSKNKKYDACFVGRFHYQKGIDDLLIIWKQVAEKYPQAIAALVGWGDENTVSNLKQRIKSHGLSKNVKLLGFLDGKEKIKIIKASKLLLFPSSFESWGVVVAEGIAAKTPVIAYNLPTLTQNFKHGVSWIKFRDIDAYSQTTITLLSNHKKRDKLIANNEYAKRFDWKYRSQPFWNTVENLE